MQELLTIRHILSGIGSMGRMHALQAMHHASEQGMGAVALTQQVLGEGSQQAPQQRSCETIEISPVV